jgi:hypothetical protein
MGQYQEHCDSAYRSAVVGISQQEGSEGQVNGLGCYLCSEEPS